MSEGWIRFWVWLATTVGWGALLNAATDWPIAGVVALAVVLGLFTCFIDMIAAAVFHFLASILD